MQVADALDALDVPYAIGDSFASAIHGVMRATMDVDLVADMASSDADPLAHALAGAFYADVESMREAVRHQGSFNLIHLATMFKGEVFLASRPADRLFSSRGLPWPGRHIRSSPVLSWLAVGGESGCRCPVSRCARRQAACPALVMAHAG